MDTESIRIRLQTVWIRTRAWITAVFQLAAVGLFLLGLYAVYESMKIYFGPVVFLDYQVPSLLGFTPIETLQYGGFLIMMIGLALCYKWIITGPGHSSRY